MLLNRISKQQNEHIFKYLSREFYLFDEYELVTNIEIYTFNYRHLCKVMYPKNILSHF